MCSKGWWFNVLLPLVSATKLVGCGSQGHITGEYKDSLGLAGVKGLVERCASIMHIHLTWNGQNIVINSELEM